MGNGKKSFEDLMKEVSGSSKKEENKKKSYDELMNEVKNERKQEEIAKVDSEYISGFVDRFNSFLETAGKDYDRIGWNNANSIYQRHQSALDALNTQRDAIGSWMINNRESLDDEAYKTLSDLYRSYQQGTSSVMKALGEARDYYNPEKNQDAYLAYVDWQNKLNYDHTAGQQKIDDLTRAYELDKDNRDLTAGGELDPNGTAWNLLEQNKQEIARIRELYGIGEDVDLREAATQETVMFNQSKWAQKEEELSSVVNLPDFMEYSQMGAAMENPSYKDATGWGYLFGWRPGADEVKNKVTFARDNAESLKKEKENRGGNTGTPAVVDPIFRHMNDDEVSIYNYYLAKEGDAKAEEYLKSIEDKLNQREAAEEYARIQGRTGLEVMYGLTVGADQFRSGISSLFDDSDYIAPSAIQYAGQAARQDLEDNGPKILGSSLGQIGYDTLSTTANMAPSILASLAIGTVSKTAGAAVGNALMGASAAGNAYAEKLNLGYSKEQAKTYGVLVGASEIVMERLLGGISAMGGSVLSNSSIKMLSQIDNVLGDVARTAGGKLLLNATSEAIEEGLQSILEPYLWQAVSGEEADVNWQETLYSALLGFATGGMFEAAPAVSTALGNAEAKRTYGPRQEAIVGEVLELEPESKYAQSMQAKLGKGKDLSGVQLSHLMEIRDVAVKEQTRTAMQSAFEAELTESGETGDVKVISEALAKKAMGEKLTRAEKKAIAKSEYGQRIAQELEAVAESEGVDDGAPEAVNIDDMEDGVAEAAGIDMDTRVAEAHDTDSMSAEEYAGIVQAAEAEVDSKGVSTEESVGFEEEIEVREGEPTATKARSSDATVTAEEDSGVDYFADLFADLFADEDGSVSEDASVSEGATLQESQINEADGTIGGEVSDSGVEADSSVSLEEASRKYGAQAKAMVATYDQGQDVGMFDRAYGVAYEMGKTSPHLLDYALSSEATSYLTPEQVEHAFKAGLAAREDIDNRRVERNKASAENRGRADKRKEGVVMGRDVDINKLKKRFNDPQGKAYKILSVIAKVTGINIVLYESKVGKDGKYMGNQGKFRWKDDTIYIDINAGLETEADAAYFGKYTMLRTFTHEFVHFIEKWNPKLYNQLRDLVIAEMKARGDDVHARIEQAMEDNKLSYERASREAVAEALSEILPDTNFVNTLARKHSGIFHKILEKLEEFLGSIKKAFREMGFNPSAGTSLVKEEMDGQIKYLESLVELFNRAAVEAVENYQGIDAEGEVVAESIAETEKVAEVEDTGAEELGQETLGETETDGAEMLESDEDLWKHVQELTAESESEPSYESTPAYESEYPAYEPEYLEDDVSVEDLLREAGLKTAETGASIEQSVDQEKRDGAKALQEKRNRMSEIERQFDEVNDQYIALQKMNQTMYEKLRKLYPDTKDSSISRMLSMDTDLCKEAFEYRHGTSKEIPAIEAARELYKYGYNTLSNVPRPLAPALHQISRFPERYGAIPAPKHVVSLYQGSRIIPKYMFPLGDGKYIAFARTAGKYSGMATANAINPCIVDENGNPLTKRVQTRTGDWDRWIHYEETAENPEKVLGISKEELLASPTIQRAISDLEKQKEMDSIVNYATTPKNYVFNDAQEVLSLIDRYSENVRQMQELEQQGKVLRNEYQTLLAEIKAEEGMAEGLGAVAELTPGREGGVKSSATSYKESTVLFESDFDEDLEQSHARKSVDKPKGNGLKYNKSQKRSRHSETETNFMIWANGSAPVGQIRKFVRFGKTHYYEKTAEGCVELSRAQYNERSGYDAEKSYGAAKREISKTSDSYGDPGGDVSGNPHGNRDKGGASAVSRQALGEELRDDAGRSVSSDAGYSGEDSSDVTQSQLRTRILTDHEILDMAAKEVEQADRDLEAELMDEGRVQYQARHNPNAKKGKKNTISDGDVPKNMKKIAINRYLIPYADKAEQWTAIDSKAVDLESRGKVINLTAENVFKYKDAVQWKDKKAVREFLRSVLASDQGVSVYFEYDGQLAIAYLTSHGIKHAVGGYASPRKAAAFEAFRELVKNAEYTFSSLHDEHSEIGKNLPGETIWDFFVSVAMIDGKPYPVAFKLRTTDSDARSQIYEMYQTKEDGVFHGAGKQESADGHPIYESIPSSGGTITQENGDVKDDVQNQLRTNTLTDHEILEMAADELDASKLTDGERAALEVFRKRAGKLNQLKKERQKQGHLFYEAQFGENKDAEKAKAARNRMSVLDGQITKASAEVLGLEDKKVLKDVLQKSRKVIEQHERKASLERIRKAREETRAKERKAADERLKALRDAKNRRIDEVRSEERQTAKEKLDKLRAEKNQRIEEVKADERLKAAERVKTVREGYKSSRLREKIKAFKGKLEKSLLQPTERQYVPAGLVKAMIDAINLIDTDTDPVNPDGTVNKAQERRDETKMKLSDLAAEYERLKASDPVYAGEFDETVYAYLTELRDNFAGRHLSEMTLGELEEMYDILRSIEETLQDARKLIGWGDAETVYEAGDSIIAEQNAITSKRKGGKRTWAQEKKDNMLALTLSPVRYVERMSGYNQGSYLYRMFKALEKGVRKKNLFKMEAYKSFEALTVGKEYEDAMYTPVGKTYTDANGRKFRLSKMQMMQAILSLEREQANGMSHIAGSGFSFADLEMLEKGKLGDAISEEHSHRVPNAVAMVGEFVELLKDDTWAQEYMSAARKFFNETAKDAINETTLALKHRIVATDKNYIPFEVDENFVVNEISAANDVQQTINSYGMLKSTTKFASNPLIITGLNNILDRHIEQVGNVHGLAVEVRNFNKIWNVRGLEAGGGDPTVKASIQRNWGRAGVKLVEQAVQDIQGPRQNAQSDLYKKVKSGYIGATFLLNLSVVSKQIGSLFSANSMLAMRGPVRQLGNLLYTMTHSKQLSAEVDKYTASAWMRRQGLSDSEVYTLMTEGKRTLMGRLASKAPAVVNPTKWITAMDHAVALSLWKYAKEDTAKRTGLKGEALLKATAEFYDEVIENTQSMTDSLHRPEIQKRSDVVSESLGMFKTDLYQMAGQLLVSKERYQANKTKENKKALGRTVYSVAMSAVWAQLMTAVFAMIRYKVNQYRDDEDKDLTGESWMKRQGMSLLADLAGYIFPLLGSEAVGLVENIIYDESEEIVDSLALTAINDLVDTATTIGSTLKDGESLKMSDVRKLSAKALQIFGIPANNILRIIEAVQLHGEDIANGEFLSFEAGVERSTGHHAHRIMEAMEKGNMGLANALFREAVEEGALKKSPEGSASKEALKSAQSSLQTAFGKKYKDGEISREMAERVLTELFEESKDDAFWTIRAWDNGGDSRYSGVFDAALSGQGFREAVKEMTGHGYEEEKVLKELKSQIRTWYTDEDSETRISKQQAVDMLRKYVGMSSDEITSVINQWSCKVVTGIEYEEIKDEFISGRITASRAIDMRVRYGGETKEEATEKVEEWKFEKEYGFAYGDRKDVYIGGEVSASQLRTDMTTYGGMSAGEADEYIGAYDWLKSNPGYDLSVSDVISYTRPIEGFGKSIEQVGIQPDVYMQYKDLRSKCKGVDANRDGKTDSGSVKSEVLKAIDSLPISRAQKDALYYLNGWSKSTIREAPWH